MASIETFVLTVGVSPVNVVTGTTTAPTTVAHWGHKGVSIAFQNQHATAKVKVAGSDVASGGIQLQGNFGAPHQVDSHNTYSGINAAEWWVVSDTADTTVVVQLSRII